MMRLFGSRLVLKFGDDHERNSSEDRWGAIAMTALALQRPRILCDCGFSHLTDFSWRMAGVEWLA